ncbi:MAG TPA: integrase core domain-containing protein [Herpetosiphonaceae bacterium]
MPTAPDGTRQPVVEGLNTVDSGTSILLDAQVRSDLVSETTLEAVAHLVHDHGLPQQVTFDRDPRCVGSSRDRDFPSAFLRFWLCLGVQMEVCPPHRPDRNAFVERYHRTFKEEWLQVYQPTTEDQVRRITHHVQRFYNEERPVRHEVAHHEWNSDKSMPLNPGLCPSLFPITTCILGNRIV